MLTDAELKTLPTMASVEIFGLLACYSAPEPLFLEDGSLNPRLPALLEEAQALQALWLKVSLGHFSIPNNSSACYVNGWTTAGWSWLSKRSNASCGRLKPMQRFNEACQTQICRYL